MAAILRERHGRTEALFIQRAARPGDPWSGHMALPGGHLDAGDASLAQAAIRETREEVGIDLTRDAQLLGPIEPVHAHPRGHGRRVQVSPFVFHLRSDQPIRLNHEVAAVYWADLGAMFRGDSFQHRLIRVAGESRRFPGYGVGDQIVWGLTLRILDNFFAMLDADWSPHHQDD